MRRALATTVAFLLLACLLLPSCGGGEREVRVVPAPGAARGGYSAVVVVPFSMDKAEVQDNPQVQEFARDLPGLFPGYVKDHMTRDRRPFLAEPPAGGGDYLLVEGRFVAVTAGNFAARFVVGFGAGRSTVEAEWTIKDGRSGAVLSTHHEAAHSGNAYRGMTAIESDARSLAKMVARTILAIR